MTILSNSAHQEALKVMQQAVSNLAKWSNLVLTYPEDTDSIKKVKQYLKWSDEPKALGLLFDLVDLSEEKEGENNEKRSHYCKPRVIDNSYPTTPYPQEKKPLEELERLKQEINGGISFLVKSPEDWKNLSLLTLILEKFASFVSFGEEGEDNVAFVDKVRATAAVASAIAENPENTPLSIIAGDLSGIQKFIYTISSDGALKSLRARSFYLELVTEEVVEQLLAQLNLPRTNVVYAGGGNIYILAPGTDNTKNITQKVQIQFNEWLRKEFQGKVYLALDSSQPFPVEDIADGDKFSQHWTNATKNLAKYKSRKFGNRVEDLSGLLESYYAHTPCHVCHRDDELDLEPLNKQEPASALACSTCRKMFQLGGLLFHVEAIVRSKPQEVPKNKKEEAENQLWFKLPACEGLEAVNICYSLFDNWKQIVPDSDTILLVNDWELEHYKFRHFRNSTPLLLGNYGAQTGEEEESGFMRANEMVQKAKGIPRMGYLRMDVDRLGQIFARGLKNQQTLPRLAGLSRQMSYFFKVYLNSLAANRQDNIPECIKRIPHNIQVSKLLPAKTQRTLLFIYAGGDDLFVSGAWNEVVDFGFDVYQCFRAYTGNHPQITLSGGISINDAKFPLYQAAAESGEAEEKAKANNKDSLTLFAETFKWKEWLGVYDVQTNNFQTVEYLKSESAPKIFGIMPFVRRLEAQEIGINYSRNFVQHLILTAQVQKQALDKFQDEEAKKSEEYKGTRYYLHLPKIAYALSRLPAKVLRDDDFRTSLKNPYNAPYFRAIATWIELLNRG